ncbi:MAG: hypothetical protein QGI09_10255, partial [Dehalococcoidia bacterium]|nr:hypothetical protein [Dehalococcoidia bacterium]
QGALPARQVHSCIDRCVTTIKDACLLALQNIPGEFPDPQVAIIHAAAFGFQADVAPTWVGVMALRHQDSVDLEGDRAIHTGDGIVVPFRARLGMQLSGKSSAAAAAIDGRHDRPVNRKDVSVGGVARSVSVSVIEDLDLDTAVEWDSYGRKVISPDKDPCVAAWIKVTPFELQHEVLVHAVCAQFTDRLSCAVQESITHNPGRGSGVYGDPAVEVDAIEEWTKIRSSLVFSFIRDSACGEQQQGD